MNITTEKIENRRDFLRKGMRTLMLGGIISIGWISGWRKSSSPENDISCVYEIPCRKCSIYDDCLDSKAVELKQDL
ncbi:hypothetical protein ACFL6O_05765, partial [candidate division KSB1 bacterium]